MAIQVSGTTVIDDSRVLSNVTGLKTVGGTAILGSGDIAVGGSTTHNAVGTYAMHTNNTGSNKFPGDTTAGSNLSWTNGDGSNVGPSPAVPAGTWQCMGYGQSGFGNGRDATVWIRTV